jgi:AraC-like DNA-binding protein
VISISGHFFRRIRRPRTIRTAIIQANSEALVELVSRCVVDRFAPISTVNSLVIPLPLSGLEEADDAPPEPCHPACMEHSDEDYCRESWQLHLAELRRQPETHWHKCDYGRFCAYVPIVYHDQCLAVVKLASPSTMTEADFVHQVELLDMLVKGFVVSEAESLSRLLRAEQTAAELGAPLPRGPEKPVDHPPNHPQVVRALRYIEEHLSEPKLTVGRIACELNIHPYYLSHLFADQVGQRMVRFIAALRVERAKTLLATTDWQVKRIALETGHANANWFCYVFRVLTGLTPGEYRKKVSGASGPSSGQ